MSRLGGTPRSASINGVSFDVMADTNVSIMSHEYENDAIPTSGVPVQKKTKRVPMAESLVLGVSYEELVVLRDWANSLDKHTFSLTFAGGDVAKAKGTFNVDSFESEECRATIKIMPDEDWTFFAA